MGSGDGGPDILLSSSTVAAVICAVAVLLCFLSGDDGNKQPTSSTLAALSLALSAYVTGFLDSLWRIFIAVRLSAALGSSTSIRRVKTVLGATSELEMEELRVADFAIWGGTPKDFIVGCEKAHLRFRPLTLLPWSRVRRYESINLRGMSLYLHQEVGVLNASFLALQLGEESGPESLDEAPPPPSPAAVRGEMGPKHISAPAGLPGVPAASAAPVRNSSSITAALSGRWARSLSPTPRRKSSGSSAPSAAPEATAAAPSVATAAFHELWVLGKGFQARVSSYADQVSDAFARMGNVKLLSRSVRGRRRSAHRFDVKELVLTEVTLRVAPSVWRGLLGYDQDVLGPRFSQSFKLSAKLGAAELATVDGEGLPAQEIGRLVTEQLMRQLAALLLKETLKTETLMSVVISSLAAPAASPAAAADAASAPTKVRAEAPARLIAPAHGGGDNGAAARRRRRYKYSSRQESPDAGGREVRKSEDLLPVAVAAAAGAATGAAAAAAAAGPMLAGPAAVAAVPSAVAAAAASMPIAPGEALEDILGILKRALVLAVLKESSRTWRHGEEKAKVGCGFDSSDSAKLLAAIGAEKPSPAALASSSTNLAPAAKAGSAATLDAQAVDRLVNEFLLRRASECGPDEAHRVLANVKIGSLLEALAAQPQFAALLADAGVDISYLEEAVAGLTAWQIVEELKSRGRALRAKAARVRAQAARLQRELLSDEEGEEGLQEQGEGPFAQWLEAASAQVAGVGTGGGGSVGSDWLLEDVLNLAAIRDVLEGLDDLRIHSVGGGRNGVDGDASPVRRSRMERALARAAARTDVYMVLSLVQRVLSFLLRRINNLPAGATHLEGRGYGCRLWNLVPRIQRENDVAGVQDVHLEMMGVSLPRRNARVMTPMGPGRFHCYRYSTRCFVVLLDWKLADGHPARAYLQPISVKIVESTKDTDTLSANADAAEGTRECASRRVYREDTAGSSGGRFGGSSSGCNGGTATKEPPPFLSLRLDGIRVLLRDARFTVQQTSFPRLKTGGTAEAALENVLLLAEFEPDLSNPLGPQAASGGSGNSGVRSSGSGSDGSAAPNPAVAAEGGREPLTAEVVQAQGATAASGPASASALDAVPHGLRLSKLELRVGRIKVEVSDTVMAPVYNAVASAFEEALRQQVVNQLEAAARRNLDSALVVVNKVLREFWGLFAQIGAATPLGSAAAAALAGRPAVAAAAAAATAPATECCEGNTAAGADVPGYAHLSRSAAVDGSSSRRLSSSAQEAISQQPDGCTLQRRRQQLRHSWRKAASFGDASPVPAAGGHTVEETLGKESGAQRWPSSLRLTFRKRRSSGPMSKAVSMVDLFGGENCPYDIGGDGIATPRASRPASVDLLLRRSHPAPLHPTPALTRRRGSGLSEGEGSTSDPESAESSRHTFQQKIAGRGRSTKPGDGSGGAAGSSVTGVGGGTEGNEGRKGRRASIIGRSLPKLLSTRLSRPQVPRSSRSFSLGAAARGIGNFGGSKNGGGGSSGDMGKAGTGRAATVPLIALSATVPEAKIASPRSSGKWKAIFTQR